MARRVNSELLLVGSLPAESADAALRSAAGFFGDLVFALPDGETGPRSAWVGYERERLVRPNPGVVVVQEPSRPPGSRGTRTKPRCSVSVPASPNCAGIPGRGSTTRSSATGCSAPCVAKG